MAKTPYRPFDKPEAVAVAAANALILFAVGVSRKDRHLALETLKEVRGQLHAMLSELNVSESDRNRVEDLLNETKLLLPLPSAMEEKSNPPRSMH